MTKRKTKALGGDIRTDSNPMIDVRDHDVVLLFTGDNISIASGKHDGKDALKDTAIIDAIGLANLMSRSYNFASIVRLIGEGCINAADEAEIAELCKVTDSMLEEFRDAKLAEFQKQDREVH